MNTEKNPPTKYPELVLTRVFDAPRDLVFKAWTEPEHLTQWWGPEGFTNPRSEWDVRPGGQIHVDMKAPYGTVYPMGGHFEEIVPPERIVFTSGPLNEKGEFIFEILNTVTLLEGDGKTILTLRTKVLYARSDEADQYLSGQAMGWAQSLEKFAAQVETAERGTDAMGTGAANQIVISRLLYAPRQMVWDAMTDPKQVVQWWGPVGFTTTIEEMDVRPGGVWKHVMRGPDGTEFPNKSVFKEVMAPERIVYSHAGGKRGGLGISFTATWNFDAIDENRTRLTIWQVFPDEGMRERVMREFGAVEGGRQTLGRLADELDKQPFVIERSYDAPVDLVWKAISEPARMKEWYFDVPEFRSEVGAEFGFAVEHEGFNFVHRCRVMEVVPGQKLAYSWRYEGFDGDSLVTFELFAEGNGTRVRLTHAGLGTFPKRPEFARKNFIGGWTSLLGDSLREYVEKSE